MSYDLAKDLRETRQLHKVGLLGHELPIPNERGLQEVSQSTTRRERVHKDTSVSTVLAKARNKLQFVTDLAIGLGARKSRWDVAGQTAILQLTSIPDTRLAVSRGVNLDLPIAKAVLEASPTRMNIQGLALDVISDTAILGSRPTRSTRIQVVDEPDEHAHRGDRTVQFLTREAFPEVTVVAVQDGVVQGRSDRRTRGVPSGIADHVAAVFTEVRDVDPEKVCKVRGAVRDPVLQDARALVDRVGDHNQTIVKSSPAQRTTTVQDGRGLELATIDPSDTDRRGLRTGDQANRVNVINHETEAQVTLGYTVARVDIDVHTRQEPVNSTAGVRARNIEVHGGRIGRDVRNSGRRVAEVREGLGRRSRAVEHRHLLLGNESRNARQFLGDDRTYRRIQLLQAEELVRQVDIALLFDKLGRGLHVGTTDRLINLGERLRRPVRIEVLGARQGVGATSTLELRTAANAKDPRAKYGPVTTDTLVLDAIARPLEHGVDRVELPSGLVDRWDDLLLNHITEGFRYSSHISPLPQRGLDLRCLFRHLKGDHLIQMGPERTGARQGRHMLRLLSGNVTARTGAWGRA